MRFIIPALISAVSVVTGFVAHGENVPVVKVGVILPMTGPMATFGTESANGLRLAMEKVGTTPPKIEFLIEDTQGTPAGSVSAINKLIKTDRVSVVIGEVASSNTLAAAPVAQENKVPLLSPASTNDSVTTGKDFVSRICFIDSFQGAVMAKFAREQLKGKTAMVLFDSDSDYSRGLRASFTKAFSESGGRIVGDVSYSQKDGDFTPQLTKVKREKPDVVFVPGYYTQVGAILRQAAELKISAAIVGVDGWNSPDLFKIAGPSVVGHFMSGHFAADDKDPAVQEFVKGYVKMFNVAPGDMAALTYDAALVVHDALRRAGSQDPDQIKNAINSTKDFAGVTGKITLDRNRNPVKPAVILKTAANDYQFFSRVQF